MGGGVALSFIFIWQRSNIERDRRWLKLTIVFSFGKDSKSGRKNDGKDEIPLKSPRSGRKWIFESLHEIMTQAKVEG